MSKLLRFFEPGQCCFITSVTAQRQPVLVKHADLLCRAVQKASRKTRIDIVAWVVLPDHFHAILRSPKGDFPTIVQRIKLSFALQFKRLSEVNGRVWQHRYWDHIIRSDEDMSRHVDYIHRNPVKHKIVDSPRKWALSSYHQFLRMGYYDAEWGAVPLEAGDEDFGE